MILNICEQSSFLGVLYYVKSVLEIIRIIVPLILIISLAIELYKIVIGKTEDINNHIKSIVAKSIAAVIVFFIPLIVNLILSIVSGTTVFNNECWNNANKETIEMYKEQEKEREEAEQAKLEEERKVAEEERKEIEKKREEARKKHEKEAEDARTEHEGGTEEPINVESSFKKYSDNKYSLLNGYYLFIPKNATTNMPLIVMFPPNSCAAADMVKLAETKNLDNLKAFIYVPIVAGTCPNKTDWSSSTSGQAVKKINEIVEQYKIDKNRISLTAFSSSAYYIYQTANDYRIFSAIAPISSGVEFKTIKNYYHDWQYLKTLPMKGYGEAGFNWSGDKKTQCSPNDSVDWSAHSSMCTVVEGLGKCSNCDKNCDSFTYVPEACHGTIGSYVFKMDTNNNGVSDIFDWMIAQEKK